MNRKERIWSVLKGLAMAAGGLLLLLLDNLWFQSQENGIAGRTSTEGMLAIIGLALLIAGAAFIWEGCRKKKQSAPKETILTACPYCGANVQGDERNCKICGKNMYEKKQIM